MNEYETLKDWAKEDRDPYSACEKCGHKTFPIHPKWHDAKRELARLLARAAAMEEALTDIQFIAQGGNTATSAAALCETYERAAQRFLAALDHAAGHQPAQEKP